MTATGSRRVMLVHHSTSTATIIRLKALYRRTCSDSLLLSSNRRHRWRLRYTARCHRVRSRTCTPVTPSHWLEMIPICHSAAPTVLARCVNPKFRCFIHLRDLWSSRGPTPPSAWRRLFRPHLLVACIPNQLGQVSLCRLRPRSLASPLACKGSILPYR